MRTRKQAAAIALETEFNVPNTCQLFVRTCFDAPSVGDFDGDGAADAEDGWKSEPLWARHLDRKPWYGSPVSYLGGSNDNGHRAIYVGGGMIRTTDGNGNGRMATRPINWPETEWGLTYAGWSETIDGLPIPADKKPKPLTKGWRIEQAEKLVEKAHAKPGTQRARLLKQISKLFAKVPANI